MIGQTLSHYRILEKLGEGGMGVLYRALDTRLDRTVAIKLLRPEAVGDADRRRRFVQEARAASALNHPNIVVVHDIDQVPLDGREVDFIAMEYVEGRALDGVVAQGPLPVSEAIDYAIDVARALAAAHGAGIVHRDVKPANVMVSRSGHVKVLDFGLAKLTEARSSSGALPTVDAGLDSPTATEVPLTRQGALVGTPAYMSPEQAEGRPVDARSDVFSFGAMLYEMLAGRRPFQGGSYVSTLTAILRDSPAPLKSLRGDVPRDLERIVLRCLAKERDARYASTADLVRDLVACRDRLAAPVSRFRGAMRRPRYVAAVVLAILAVTGVSVWLWMREAGPRWARDVALPEIARLVESRDYYAAYPLVRQAERHLPGHPVLRRYWVDNTFPLPLDTDPTGAEVLMKPYRTPEAQWVALGLTPLQGVRIPFGNLRFRIEKDGFEPIEVASDQIGPIRVGRFRLDSRKDAVPGMVRVPGGNHQYRSLPPVELADFWLDRHEVTNALYKEFVDGGGYRSREYWKAPLVKDGRVLPWEEAIALFRDSTGRPGPASWELGAFPEGQGDHPVSGVSWFEAAAYARFAGKALPTLYHWTWAAGTSYFHDILLLSNFGGRGPEPVGEQGGLSPFGAYDMAGNVKEWCWNGSGARRYILGGGWNEPSYMFNDADAQSPWDRSATHGFRCAMYAEPLPQEQLASVDVVKVTRDYAAETPVSDEVFRVYRSIYSYDRTDLNAVVESVDEAEHWRHETVSFDAAYGKERVLAHLFLPRNARPPYQTVIYVPPGEALFVRSSADLRMRFQEIVLRSGRALLHPVYKGTYERRLAQRTRGPGELRDLLIQIAKDLGRSLDYLETRPDVDRRKVAYYGISMGAIWGPWLLGVEDRFQAAVLQGGGFRFTNPPPEVDPINFAPRVRTPVLMLNGRHDFELPLEASQKPLFNLLGTPEKDKRHVIFEAGHADYPANELIKEMLDWFDRYLGPVAVHADG